MLDALDVSAITDPAAGQIIGVLVQIIEAQGAEIALVKETNQQLRDEIARLKGEQGKPTIRPRVLPQNRVLPRVGCITFLHTASLQPDAEECEPTDRGEQPDD